MVADNISFSLQPPLALNEKEFTKILFILFTTNVQVTVFQDVKLAIREDDGSS